MYLLIATDNALAFARAGFCKDKTSCIALVNELAKYLISG